MLGQLFRFGLVGALATLLHVLVGVTLIDAGWAALSANAISFVIAFLISFTGHYGFSFPDHSTPLSTSFNRFFLVACSGFAVNEMLLALFLWSSLMPDVLGLVLSTGVAAVLTFLVCRNWAFNGRKRPTRSGSTQM